MRMNYLFALLTSAPRLNDVLQLKKATTVREEEIRFSRFKWITGKKCNLCCLRCEHADNNRIYIALLNNGHEVGR